MAASHPCIAAAVFCSLIIISQASQTCAPECFHEGLYLPHPQDCTKFYICGGGKVAFESECQAGLYYNMKERRCDYPENVYCLATPERACDENLLEDSLSSQKPSPTVSSQKPSSVMPSQKPPTTAAQPSQTCAPQCLHEGLYLPHPQDCTKFYICGGGKVAFESKCQTGLYYNMIERRCDYPENVYCLATPERACDDNLLEDSL